MKNRTRNGDGDGASRSSIAGHTADRRQGYGGPPSLHSRAEAGTSPRKPNAGDDRKVIPRISSVAARANDGSVQYLSAGLHEPVVDLVTVDLPKRQPVKVPTLRSLG